MYLSRSLLGVWRPLDGRRIRLGCVKSRTYNARAGAAAALPRLRLATPQGAGDAGYHTANADSP